MAIEIKTKATLVLTEEQKTALRDTLNLIEELYYCDDEEDIKNINLECESQMALKDRRYFDLYATMHTLHAVGRFAEIF